MRFSCQQLSWLQKIFRLHISPKVELRDDGEKVILQFPGRIGQIEFTNFNSGFLSHSGDMPCSYWNPREAGLNSILGLPLPIPGESAAPQPLVSQNEEGFRLNYDLPGLTYWTLARVEEIQAPASYFGDHQRILGTASHAFRNQYLERPIIDEWMHVVRQLVLRQWPNEELVCRVPRTLVSCDVDVPFSVITSASGAIRRMLSDLFVRMSPKAFWNSLLTLREAQQGRYDRDPLAQNVEYIMDVNDRVGNSVVFYFITLCTDVRDGQVNIDDPRLCTLFQRVHSRGHQIGIHPGYHTYRSPENFRKSVERLRDVIKKAAVKQTDLGGRQHYLRWETPLTARLYAENGLSHDSTLGYADRAGFRCGTCWEFPMFDHTSQRELNVLQRPLVLMDDTIINKRYMGLGYTPQALEYMCRIRETCHRVSGDFTLLWHNTFFKNKLDKVFYETLIA